jgi:hypothetical protein
MILTHSKNWTKTEKSSVKNFLQIKFKTYGKGYMHDLFQTTKINNEFKRLLSIPIDVLCYFITKVSMIFNPLTASFSLPYRLVVFHLSE